MRVLAAVLGLSFLLLAVAVPAAVLAFRLDMAAFGIPAAGSMLLVLLSAAAFCVCLFWLAGSLLSGVMALFFVTVINHFLSGGFLPCVFLPEGIRSLGRVLPSGILMDGGKMIVTGTCLYSFGWHYCLECAFLYVYGRRQIGNETGVDLVFSFL